MLEIVLSYPCALGRHVGVKPSLKDRTHTLKPLLRWAGGKQWLANQLRLIMPDTIGTYYEPFFGGGSLFFAARPKDAVLSDLNVRLMETYEMIRSQPNEIMTVLGRWPNDETTYYRLRNKVFVSQVSRAAQFIYLNKTCWNGLYRVNRLDRFNVPFGYHGRRVFDKDHVLEVATALKDATLKTGDFEDVVRNARSGDLIYFDPPYATNCRKSGFRHYTANRFNWHDQERLAATATGLSERGCSVIVSNANYEPIVSLYPSFCPVVVSRHSILAADPRARRVIDELVLCSNSDFVSKLESG